LPYDRLLSLTEAGFRNGSIAPVGTSGSRNTDKGASD
jgi:hypothetical protein